MKSDREEREENIFGDTNLIYSIMVLFLLNMLQYIMRDRTEC